MSGGGAPVVTTLFKYPSGGNYYAGQIVGSNLQLYVNKNGGPCVIIESGKYVGAEAAGMVPSLLEGLKAAATRSGYTVDAADTIICPVALNETIPQWETYVSIS